MLLTIAIPAYNAATNFQGLFTSIYNLRLKEADYEILVVDNNSEDDTSAVIEGFRRSMPNLRYSRNDRNIGRIENWNKAIELSDGEFVVVMNVNDRFLNFNMAKHLRLLVQHPELCMVLADIEFKSGDYPRWKESGVIKLKTYLRKTFLDNGLLEFHALGVLHQHIFRRSAIVEHGILFDPKLPRTTDRVFVAEVVNANGGKFYYVNEAMVSWRLNPNRYHFGVHNDPVAFDFEQLWKNEYAANLQLSKIAEIDFKDFIGSQLLLARSYIFKYKLENTKKHILKIKSTQTGIEFPTAAVYYAYVCAIAELHAISVNKISIFFTALKIVLREFLTHHKFISKRARALGNIVSKPE